MHDLCVRLSDVADTKTRATHERRLQQVRKMRESEAEIARAAIEEGAMTQGEVAYLLGRSREWLRRRGIGGE